MSHGYYWLDLERAVDVGFRYRHRPGVIYPRSPRDLPPVSTGAPDASSKAIRRAKIRGWVADLRRERARR